MELFHGVPLAPAGPMVLSDILLTSRRSVLTPDHSASMLSMTPGGFCALPTVAPIRGISDAPVRLALSRLLIACVSL